MPQQIHPVTARSIVVRASESGCALDADLLTGASKASPGAASTDDGPRLSAIAQTATRSNPVEILLDGAAKASCLYVPAAGHFTLRGLGADTGIYAAKQANDGIRNSVLDASNLPYDPGPSVKPPPRGGHLNYLDFFLNASQVGDAGAQWAFGISVLDVQNVRLENVTVYEPVRYGVRFSNVGHAAIDNYRCVRANIGDRPFNTDGLHFDGLCDSATISRSHFESGDDAIAINTVEGLSGDCGDFTIDACDFLNCYDLLRIYTSASEGNGKTVQNTVNSVHVSNCRGSFYGAVFLFGLYTPTTNFGGGGPAGVARSIRSFRMSASHVSGAPLFAAVSTHMGFVSFTDVLWELTQPVTYGAFPFYNGAVVETMRFDSFRPVDAGGGAMAALLDFTKGGAVRHLIIDSLDAAMITACVKDDAWSNVTTVSGAGVLGTGWRFPDSVMADHCLYLSATAPHAGRLCIKLGGVVNHLSTVATG